MTTKLKEGEIKLHLRENVRELKVGINLILKRKKECYGHIIKEEPQIK